MITEKRLSGGGDIALKEMINISSVLSKDLIELLWIPRNRQPYPSVVTVVGYKFPIVNHNMNMFDSDTLESDWVDGILRFYPDDHGRCWGYVYDTEENRKIIATTLASGWYKIVDKKIKDEIVELAKSLGVPHEPIPDSFSIVKKNVNEKKTSVEIDKLTKEKEEMEFRMKQLEKRLFEATEEKATLVNTRIRGVQKKEKEPEVE
jgi:hypothetical protein